MSKSKLSIDIDKIEIPKVSISKEARWQIANMLENDPYLAGKFLRITIDGKGCDGFTYAIGFTTLQNDDFCVETTVEAYSHPEDEDLLQAENKAKQMETKILFDPFAAFYLSEVQIHYQFDATQDIDGFVVTNVNQESFHGKFWRKSDKKTPPERSQENI